jgi:hypothetical protein
VFKELEYLPMALKSLARNVYFLMEKQNLPTCNIVPMEPKLKAIFCITSDCVKRMNENFPSTKERIVLLQEPKSKSNRLTANVKNMLVKSVAHYHTSIVTTTLKHMDFSGKGYFGIMKIGGYTEQNYEMYTCLNSETNAIFVEPIRSHFDDIKNGLNNMYDGNKFIYVNACVSNNIGKMNLVCPSATTNAQFQIQSPFLYSNNKKHFERVDCDLDSIWVKTITINQLVKDFEMKEIFLLIVETGFHDFEILMSIDFKLKPKYIKFASEHMTSFGNRGTKYNLVVNYLEKNGYRIVEENDHCTLMNLRNSVSNNA